MTVRNAILAFLRAHPAEAFTDEGLARQFGVTRMAVNIAARALARDGLISRAPRLGASQINRRAGERLYNGAI